MEEGRKLLADHGDVLIEEVEPYIKASIAADDERARRELAAATEQAEVARQLAEKKARPAQAARRLRHCSSVRADRSARHRGVRISAKGGQAGGRPPTRRGRGESVESQIARSSFGKAVAGSNDLRGRDSRHAPGAPGAASRRE